MLDKATSCVEALDRVMSAQDDDIAPILQENPEAVEIVNAAAGWAFILVARHNMLIPEDAFNALQGLALAVYVKGHLHALNSMSVDDLISGGTR